MPNTCVVSELVEGEVLDWAAGLAAPDIWHYFGNIGRRFAYVLMAPDINSEDGALTVGSDAAMLTKRTVHMGNPVRNSVNTLSLDWDDALLTISLRDTDTFGEVLIAMEPTKGTAVAYSITIDRILKGGVSSPSPRPEEQVIERLGRYNFAPVPVGKHELSVKALEEAVSVAIDGETVFEFEDPDVSAGLFSIGTAGKLGIRSFRQAELISGEEAVKRKEFVAKMTAYCAELDSHQDDDIAQANSISFKENNVRWCYPDTGAMVTIMAEPGKITGVAKSGLYGNLTLFDGFWATPEVIDTDEAIWKLAPDIAPKVSGDKTCFRLEIPLESGGKTACLTLTSKLTENSTWFCTAEITGITVKSVALAFAMDNSFEPNWEASGAAGEPAKLAYGAASMLTDGQSEDPGRAAFGMPKAHGELHSSLIINDGAVGHAWNALSGYDTKFEIQTVAQSRALIIRSEEPRFRWATMWLPYHKLNLMGYKKRMVHFIRYPEEPNSAWKEQPSQFEYPTDEELERFASHGVTAMVWHHTWAGNNFRAREGFIVNEKEMSRAAKKAQELGIDVLPYIGIVPGRHPVLRWADLSQRSGYDINWDLQDYTFYSVAGRFSEFLPFMTDIWCKEYGIDGFYSDGGLAQVDWGRGGWSSETHNGLSLEELNDRLYSRIKRVLRRNNARFGLENWGASGVHLAGPWYDCRMIGEEFQEARPEMYYNRYNPLVTGTPFKMYAMDLVARNRYNIAMAAVCMTDLQFCSGNYAWGNWPDRPSDWRNLMPFWTILDSIEWDQLTDARPWWKQKLVRGDGFYAGYYATGDRVVLFVANRTETPGKFGMQIDQKLLPDGLANGTIRQIYPEAGTAQRVPVTEMAISLPALHDGPIGFEIISVNNRA